MKKVVHFYKIRRIVCLQIWVNIWLFLGISPFLFDQLRIRSSLPLCHWNSFYKCLIALWYLSNVRCYLILRFMSVILSWWLHFISKLSINTCLLPWLFLVFFPFLYAAVLCFNRWQTENFTQFFSLTSEIPTSRAVLFLMIAFGVIPTVAFK